ncbi:major facilitator superfamily domain-containing protein [Aspergillus unguis]
MDGDDGDELVPSRVLRKVDRRLIPLLFTTYMLSFMDKTILSSASVFGLIDDTHLVGQQYSWVSSIFYLGYLLWQWPTTILIPRIRVAKYLAANTLVWGTVVALTAACTNYMGLLAVRFLLGVAEATITPAFMFITTTWYTRDEIPVRTGIWFSGNSFGGLLASLLAYGVGHIDHPLRPWMWMFIILGVATFVWGFVIWAFLPDNISGASFLAGKEKALLSRRAVVSGTGRTEGTRWNTNQAIECFSDPKTWHLLGITALTQVPNGGIQNFANLVVKSFGFTALESTMINIPVSLFGGATITLTGYLTGQFKNVNCMLIVCVLALSGTGSILIYMRAAELLGYILLATGPGALPLTMSLAQTNYKGVTKKMTMTGSMFVAYCLGNIAGPHLFSTETASYEGSFRTVLLCYALAAGLVFSLYIYLWRLNDRRDREEAGLSNEALGRQPVERDHPGTEISPLLRQRQDSEDTTDWNTVGFRYHL